MDTEITQLKKSTKWLLLILSLLAIGSAYAQEPPAHVTILYDAFGKPSDLKRGWGYSALVEYGGKRILFDTGGESSDFAYNVNFDGQPPAKMTSGTLWPGAQFSQIRDLTEVLTGFFLLSTRSDVTGTKEMNELSLSIKTPKGMVVIVGWSHPGIEKILAAASKVDSQIHAVFGGFHLVDIPDAEVTRMATAFKDKWKIDRLAPGHCTGQFAFAELIRVYGANFDRPGLGSVIALPV